MPDEDLRYMVKTPQLSSKYKSWDKQNPLKNDINFCFIYMIVKLFDNYFFIILFLIIIIIIFPADIILYPSP